MVRFENSVIARPLYVARWIAILSSQTTSPEEPAAPTSLIVRLAPIIFVLLWSTGFPGAKIGTTNAEPFTFLTIRFALTLAILVSVVVIAVRPNLRGSQFFHSMVSGVLVHGFYLGGVFFAIDRGMPAGISALLVSLQPFFTAAIAWFLLGERMTLKRIGFFLAALFGVFLVLFPELDIARALPGITGVTLTAAVIAVLGISIGTVYQKRFVSNLNLWVSTTGQFVGALIPLTLLSFLVETREVTWSLDMVLAMAWLILMLSIGAVALLMYLIRQGSATSVASLFFLVPVFAAIESWLLFDERLIFLQLVGGGIAIAAVALSSRLAK